MSVDNLVEIYIAVVALEDFSLWLDGTNDLLEFLQFLRLYLGSLVEQDDVAELNLLHHHHDHDHEEGEAEEYGIGTFVYYSRKPFDLGLFDEFVARKWPRDVVRAKGICYFADEKDMCYVFEQAGKQKTVKQAGQWLATMPKDQLDELLAREEQLRKEWDPEVGDRMIKIVFIGQHLQKEAITAELDKCLWD